MGIEGMISDLTGVLEKHKGLFDQSMKIFDTQIAQDENMSDELKQQFQECKQKLYKAVKERNTSAILELQKEINGIISNPS